MQLISRTWDVVEGGGGAVALTERVVGCDSGCPVIRSDPVVVILASGLTGASQEGTRAAVVATRARTICDDGHRAVAVTAAEKVDVVDVAIVISPVVATVDFEIGSTKEPEQVVVAKGIVLETVIDFREG